MIRKLPKKIANRTLAAAVVILGGDAAPDKIKEIATTGGVTEAALAVLTKNQFAQTIEQMVKVAKKRSEELSK